MDIRGVKRKTRTWDRFRLVKSALQHYGGVLQLVVVYPEQKVNGFFENMVVNHGGNEIIFTDLALARKRLGIEESAVVVK